MIKAYNYTVDTIGGIYGIANIKEVLGLVVLILTILNVFINMGYKLWQAIKKRKIEAINEVLEQSKDEINQAIEDFKEIEGEDNDN